MEIKELNYNRIVDVLVHETMADNARAYTRLASERELADKYNCSRVTIRKALNILERKGCISRVKGQGTFWIEAPSAREAVGPVVKPWRISLVVFNFGLQHGLLHFLNGMEHATECNHDYQYSVWHIDHHQRDTAESFTQMANTDGYIVAGDFRLADLSWFINTRKPMVVLGQAIDKALSSLSSRPFTLVRLDVARGWEMAAEQLLSEGFRRPAVLVASRHRGYVDRHEGVLRAMRRLGLPKEDCRLVVADPMADSGAISPEQLYAGVEKLWTEEAPFDCLLTTIEPVLVVAAAQRRGVALDRLFPVVAECNQSDLTSQCFGFDTLSDDMSGIGVQCVRNLLGLLDGALGYSVVNCCPRLTQWRKTGARADSNALAAPVLS